MKETVWSAVHIEEKFFGCNTEICDVQGEAIGLNIFRQTYSLIEVKA